MKYPKFTWDKERGGKKKDPINLVFEKTSIEKILKQFNDSGWHFNGKWKDLVSDQFTPDKVPRKKQYTHKLKGNFFYRYHTRIWAFRNYQIASSHKERFDLSFGYNEKRPWFPIRLDHTPYGFEQGKEQVEKDFCKTPWIVNEDKHFLNNSTENEYSNGYASEIRNKNKN